MVVAPFSLPHNDEAEQMVLGCMLLDSDAARIGVATLRAQDFYRSAHQFIFSAIAMLHLDGKPVDLVLVGDYLRDRGQLDAVGGIAYLHGLTDPVFSAGLFTHHAQVLKKHALKRSLLDVGQELQRQSSDGEAPEQVLSDTRDVLELLVHTGVAAVSATSLDEFLADASPAPLPLVEGLIYPQTTTMLAGYTKIGKTQFALQIACAGVSAEPVCGLSVAQPFSVLYIGQEDVTWALRERMRGLSPRFGPRRAQFHLLATKGMLLEGGAVAQLVAAHRPVLLILDPFRRFHTREEEKGEMAHVMRQLDLLCRDFGCAILVLHHMRKPPADQRKKNPEIHDIRGHSVITDQVHTIARLQVGAEPDLFTLRIEGNYTERHTLQLHRTGPLFAAQHSNERVTVSLAVDLFADRPPMSRADAGAVLQEAGYSRAHAYRQVSEFEKNGWLRRLPDGRLQCNPGLLGALPDVRMGSD